MKRGKYSDTLTPDLFKELPMETPETPKTSEEAQQAMSKPLSDKIHDYMLPDATATPSRLNTDTFTLARSRLREERERRATETKPETPKTSEEAQQAMSKPLSDKIHDYMLPDAMTTPSRLNTDTFTPPQDHDINISARAGMPPLVILAACIGSGCFVMSVINTFLFLSGSGKSFMLSFATAALTAAFSASAFTLGKTRGLRRFLFFIMACVIIAFSVFSTVAVSYEQLKTVDLRSQSSLDFVRQTEALAEINFNEKAELNAEIQRLAGQLTELRAQADYWRNKSWDRYDAMIASAADTQRRIDALRERSLALGREARQITARHSETEKARGDTVYAFMRAIIGIDENIIRFIIFCIPAVFFDIASPLMLGILFNFLKK
ncbi:MAG: hypothetical protein LBP19_05205 [Treponema sp.]|jgi:hypothetical protein|nr:hypothetical protein [Treponema sp.]